MLLKDKVCLVTGAAAPRSIGLAVAELFAEHGAKVIVADVAMTDRVAREIKTSIERWTQRESDVIGLRCDVASIGDCDQAVNQVVALHGTLDCLIHCAGIVRTQQLMHISENDFDLIMDTNLKGTFNICKSVLTVFTARRAGVIVNLASSAAQRGGGFVGGAHYAASKGGVLSLTRTIAREFGPHGIRANAVCPAMIETSMLDGISATKRAEITAAVPLQRTGTPRECAGACLFLASELSGFVTGATIDVNGGSHIH
jgi:NAD(P)-dependent dehydrogenase (short-subunit alcohol dehydrogenase family)